MRALKRLVLLIFFLSLLAFGLFLSHQRLSPPPENFGMEPSASAQKAALLSENSQKAGAVSLSPAQKNKSGVLDLGCPFYLGLSLFPLSEKKYSFFKGEKPPPWAIHLISERKFAKSAQAFLRLFKQEGISFKKALFAFPLALTKDEKRIISRKSFVIFPSGERKELSHIGYLELKRLYREIHPGARPLRLKEALSYIPPFSPILIYTQGSDRERMIKSLKSFGERTKRELYVFSPDERLLRGLGPSDWRALRSFKALLRFQLAFPFRAFFQPFPGQGLLIPSALSFSPQSLAFLKSQKKLLFLERDPPYDLESLNLIPAARALISSQPRPALSAAKNKKPCFIKE